MLFFEEPSEKTAFKYSANMIQRKRIKKRIKCLSSDAMGEFSDANIYYSSSY